MRNLIARLMVKTALKNIKNYIFYELFSNIHFFGHFSACHADFTPNMPPGGKSQTRLKLLTVIPIEGKKPECHSYPPSIGLELVGFVTYLYVVSHYERFHNLTR